MRIHLIVLAASLIASANASSQEPGNEKTVTHKQQTTEQKKAAPKKQVASVKKPKPEVVQEAEHKTDVHAEEKLSLDRNLVEYTRQLAVYTEELSKHTSEVSSVIFWLVCVTGCIAAVGVWQGWQLKHIGDPSREKCIATDGPRLIIRRISTHLDDEEDLDLPGVVYEIANIGGTKARIVEISAMLWLPDLSVPFPTVPQHVDSTRLNTFVESGEPFQGKCTIAFEDVQEYRSRLACTVVPRVNPPARDIYFLGKIVYRDQLDRRFETAFLRGYDPHTKRFMPVQDDDYEYQA